MKKGDKYHKDGVMHTIEEVQHFEQIVYHRSTCGTLHQTKLIQFVSSYSKWIPTIAQQCAAKSK